MNNFLCWIMIVVIVSTVAYIASCIHKTIDFQSFAIWLMCCEILRRLIEKGF